MVGDSYEYYMQEKQPRAQAGTSLGFITTIAIIAIVVVLVI
jgi:hypothetical protein